MRGGVYREGWKKVLLIVALTLSMNAWYATATGNEEDDLDELMGDDKTKVKNEGKDKSSEPSPSPKPAEGGEAAPKPPANPSTEKKEAADLKDAADAAAGGKAPAGGTNTENKERATVQTVAATIKPKLTPKEEAAEKETAAAQAKSDEAAKKVVAAQARKDKADKDLEELEKRNPPPSEEELAKAKEEQLQAQGSLANEKANAAKANQDLAHAKEGSAEAAATAKKLQEAKAKTAGLETEEKAHTEKADAADKDLKAKEDKLKALQDSKMATPKEIQDAKNERDDAKKASEEAHTTLRKSSEKLKEAKAEEAQALNATETDASRQKQALSEAQTAHEKAQTELAVATSDKEAADKNLRDKENALYKLNQTKLPKGATQAEKDQREKEISKARADLEAAKTRSTTANQAFATKNSTAKQADTAYKKELGKSMTPAQYKQYTATLSQKKSVAEAEKANEAESKYTNSKATYEAKEAELKNAQRDDPKNTKRIDELKAQRDAASDQMKSDQRALKKARADAQVSHMVAIDAAEDLQDRMDVINTKQADLDVNMKSTQEQLTASDTQLIQANQDLDAAKAQEASGIGKPGAVAEAQAQKDKIASENANLKNKMEGLKQDQERLNKDKEKYKEAKDKYTKLEAQYQAAQIERATLEKEVEKANEALTKAGTAPGAQQAANNNLQIAKANLKKSQDNEKRLAGEMEQAKGGLYTTSKNRQDLQDLLQKRAVVLANRINKWEKKRQKLEAARVIADKRENIKKVKRIDKKISEANVMISKLKAEEKKIPPVIRRLATGGTISDADRQVIQNEVNAGSGDEEFDPEMDDEDVESDDEGDDDDDMSQDDDTSSPQNNKGDRKRKNQDQHADYLTGNINQDPLKTLDPDTDLGQARYGEGSGAETLFDQGDDNREEGEPLEASYGAPTESGLGNAFYGDGGGVEAPSYNGENGFGTPNYSDGGVPLGAQYGPEGFGNPFGTPNYGGGDIGTPNYGGEGQGMARYNSDDLPWASQPSSLYSSDTSLGTPNYTWDENGELNTQRLTGAPGQLTPFLMVPKSRTRQFTHIESAKRIFDSSAPAEGATNVEAVRQAKVNVEIASARLKAANDTRDPKKINAAQIYYDESLIRYGMALNANSAVGTPLKEYEPGWYNDYNVPPSGFIDADSGGKFAPSLLTSENVTQFIDTSGQGIQPDQGTYIKRLRRGRTRATVEEGIGFEIVNPSHVRIRM